MYNKSLVSLALDINYTSTESKQEFLLRMATGGETEAIIFVIGTVTFSPMEKSCMYCVSGGSRH